MKKAIIYFLGFSFFLFIVIQIYNKYRLKEEIRNIIKVSNINLENVKSEDFIDGSSIFQLDFYYLLSANYTSNLPIENFMLDSLGYKKLPMPISEKDFIWKNKSLTNNNKMKGYYKLIKGGHRGQEGRDYIEIVIDTSKMEVKITVSST